MTPPELTGLEASHRAASSRYFTSGSETLDGLLQGGFRARTVVEVLGKSNSGKTQLAFQVALYAAHAGRHVLFVDTEGSFRPERLQDMAEARGWDPSGVLDRIVSLRTDSFAEQSEVVSEMDSREASRRCSLVIIDTLTRNFSIGLPGKSNLPERQRALAVYLSEASRDAFLRGRAYLLTNRVTFGVPREVAIGGKTVEQMVQTSILLEREGTSIRATNLATRNHVLLSLNRVGVQ